MNGWRQTLFNKDLCSGSLMYHGNGDLIIKGQLKSNKLSCKLFFWAASPPTLGISFSGSGMPYPNASVAYDRTPNKGVIDVVNGQFTINMKYPNAYYIGLGSLYVAPHINFKLCQEGHADSYFTVQIDDGIPFRTLTYPAPPSKKPRTSALFYHEPECGARSQEAILRVSGYPATNTTPDNFWGERPPR
jgi:hypothetical protein